MPDYTWDIDINKTELFVLMESWQGGHNDFPLLRSPKTRKVNRDSESWLGH
jgi:hypothetical protein